MGTGIQNATKMVGPFSNVCATTTMRRFIATLESTFELFKVTEENEKKLGLRSLIASHKIFTILELEDNKNKTFDEQTTLLIAVHDGETKQHWTTASNELCRISYSNFSSLADYFRRVCELQADLDGKLDKELVINFFAEGLPPHAAMHLRTQKIEDLMTAFKTAAKLCKPSDFQKPAAISTTVPVNQVKPRVQVRQCYLCGKKGHEQDDCPEVIPLRQLYPDHCEEFYNGIYDDDEKETEKD